MLQALAMVLLVTDLGRSADAFPDVPDNHWAVDVGGQSHAVFKFNEQLSVLHPGESTLATLIFIFQGWPDGVAGLEFQYSDKQKWEYEKYLVRLLAAPKPGQVVLRDSAVFLASRFYMDPNYKTFLALGAHDSLNYRVSLYYMKTDGLSRSDRLFREALYCYFTLKRDRKAAVTQWTTGMGNGTDPAKVNVGNTLRSVEVSDRIDDSWKPPYISR